LVLRAGFIILIRSFVGDIHSADQFCAVQFPVKTKKTVRMSADIKVLLEAQYDIHGRMSRSVDNLRKMGVSNITRDAIQARITILDNLWSKLEAQHELVRSTLKDKYHESEYAKSEFIDVAENTYVTQRSTLAGYAEKLKGEVPTASKSEPGPEQTPRTSLPRIKLQTFSGAYEEWPAFRDLFLSIIGDNSAISAVEKLHYLRSCLQGPAESLIRPLSVTGSSYERAWSILSRHFENKRELIRSNFASFTAVPRMKSETADELNRVYNAVTTAVNAQESIDRPIASHGTDLFNYLVVELFDPQTRLEWESSTCDSIDSPSHDTLTDFISKRILTLNAAKPRSATAKSEDAARSAKSHFTQHTSNASRCVVCKEEHSIMQCSQFKAKSASDRKSFVEANKLCYNCLGNHFMAQCQSVKTCVLCQSRHHTLLHDGYQLSTSAEVSSLSAVLPKSNRKAILLATARVTITDQRGRPQAVRVLVDQGFEVSLVSEALAQRLRLPRARSSLTIMGIGGASTGATHGKTLLSLSSETTGTTLSVVAHVLPHLSSYSGPTMRHISTWPHIRGLPLADPRHFDQDPIDLLLGADVYSAILQDGLRKSRADEPIAQKTALGWILSGGSRTTLRYRNSSDNRKLNEPVQRFREQGKEPSTPDALTPQDLRSPCTAGGIHCRKRTATDDSILAEVPQEHRLAKWSDRATLIGCQGQGCPGETTTVLTVHGSNCARSHSRQIAFF